MRTFIDTSKDFITVISYHPDQPNIFIDSVREFLNIVTDDPSAIIGDDEDNLTALYFSDANGDIIAKKFNEVVAIANAIGKNHATQEALFSLAREYVQLMPRLSGGGAADCETSIGQALMHGLISAGSGAHSKIVEDWMLNLDWDHEVEQSDIVFRAMHEWDYCQESLRLAILRVTLCSGQAGSDDFEWNMDAIVENKERWPDFILAGQSIKRKLENNPDYDFIESLWPSYQNLKSNELNIKLVRACIETNSELARYWKSHIKYDVTVEQQRQELKDWYDEMGIGNPVLKSAIAEKLKKYG